MRVKKSPLAMISTGEDRALRIRRFFWITFFVFVFVFLIWAYITLNKATTFPIKWVKIEGSYPHIDQAAFQKKLVPLTTGGFFQVNIEHIKQEALTFPWIYQADVRKVFPNTLIIVLTEQTPVAQWNDSALLNADGDLFVPAITTFPANLPVLYGPKDQSSMMLATFERMNQILKPINLQIQRMDLSDRRAWRIQLSSKVQVILGRYFIWQRLQRFVAVYPKVFATSTRKAKIVDMRYPNGFAVAWQR